MGNEQPRRVFVIEHDRDLGEMFAAVLSAEGYKAEWRMNGPGVLAEVRQHQPDLLVVDVPVVIGDTAYDFLDLLRSDEALRGIQVLVVTTSEHLAEGALASYNVKGTLLKPFDLEEFIERADHAMSQPSFHRRVPAGSRPEGILGLAERILSVRSRDTLFRWVQRLRIETPLGERDHLEFADVLDNVPILIEALDAAFHYQTPKRLLESSPDIAERVCIHVSTRRGQGVPLALLMQEYALLREEIWRSFWRELPERLERDDLARLQSLVDGTLDLIIQYTIPSYLENRVRTPGER